MKLLLMNVLAAFVGQFLSWTYCFTLFLPLRKYVIANCELSVSLKAICIKVMAALAFS